MLAKLRARYALGKPRSLDDASLYSLHLAPSASCNFVRDGAADEPRSHGDASLYSLRLAARTTVCEPCVTLTKRRFLSISVKWCQGAFLPLSAGSCMSV